MNTARQIRPICFSPRAVCLGFVVWAILILAPTAFAVAISGSVRHAETNTALSGFIVTFGGAQSTQEAVVGDNGTFSIDVPSSDTELRVLSATRVLFVRQAASENNGQFRIQPTGVIYDATSGKPAAGVGVRLLYDSPSRTPVEAPYLELNQQNQVTDKHGLYRFDLSNLPQSFNVIVDLDTVGTTHQFPSTALPPPESCSLNSDNTQVLGPVTPNPSNPGAYCLQLSVSSGDSTLPIHNHIPVDGSASSLTIRHLASKSEVAVGDVVTYTIRVENRGSTSYDPSSPGGGVWVRVAMSNGLRLLAESAKASLNGEPIELAADKGPSLIRFQAKPGDTAASMLPFPSGSELLIRYQVVVDAQVRERKLLASRAQLMDPGGVGLSDVGKVAVRFSRDPIFDRSWIRGRVFCDQDGDGWADESEKGVYGAHVYIDTGRYAITDPNGLYHLTDVPPGLHVVKIDDNTVPPGSISIGPVSRSLHVSPGISQQVSFGFRCNIESVGPTEVTAVDSAGPVIIPDVIVVSGTLKAMDVLIDGERSAADGTASLAVLGAPEGGVPLDLDWHPKSNGSRVTFDIRVPKNTQQSRLWIEMRSPELDWSVSRVVHKDGPIGPRIEWDRTDDSGNRVDQIGTLYRARLEAIDGVGGRWTTPSIYFTVGAKRSGPVLQTTINGSPLTRRKNLSRSAKRLVKDLVKKSRNVVSPQVLIQMGIASNDVTEKLIRAMTKKGFLKPNQIGVRIKSGFSGVVLMLYDSEKSAFSPINLPQKALYSPRVLVSGKSAVLDKKGRFVTVLNKTEQTVTAVEWTNKDGIRREVLIRLSDGNGIPSSRLIQANLEKRLLRVGDDKIDLAPLALKVGLPYEVGRIDDGVPSEPITFSVSIESGLLSEWKLTVTGPDGSEAFSANGTGNPSVQVPWVAPTKMKAGDYIVQLVGTTAAGAQIQSARHLMLMMEGSEKPAEGTLLDTIGGRLFDSRKNMTARFRKKLRRLAKNLSERAVAEQFLVEVHWDGAGDDEPAVSATSNEATRIRNALLLSGLDGARFKTVGIGNGRVLADPNTATGRKENRRIEVRLLDSVSGKPVQRWTVQVDGKPMSLTKDGIGTARLGGEAGEQSKIRVVSPEKNSLEQTVTIAESTPDAEEEKEVPFGISNLSRSLEHQERTGKPAPPVAVSTLQVELPPDGSELGHPILPISGRAPNVAGVQIRINGKDIPVKGGRFQVLLPLAEDEESTVVIEARDSAGNIAQIRRTYRVKGSALFLLALADGALTQTTTQLPGVGSDTSIRINDVPAVNDLYLHGRGALYLKARIRGNDLLKTVRITAYADSARAKDGTAFAEQVIDPKRHYPVYGDQSHEVSDVRTRGKYFVAVEADPGKIIVGSFRAGDWGIEMLRYGRTLEGAQLELKKAFVAGYETVVKGFVSYDDRQTRRGQATMRGTGGSYYFLPNRDVIEGSERVSIAIRDRDTGSLIQEISQVADLDYRLDYAQGHLTFRKPIPSHATSSFTLGAADVLSGQLALEGHPVFIRVDYETRDPKDAGEVSWGVYGRQTISEMVSLGGGYLREGNQADTGPDYELWGTDLQFRWGRTLRLSAELAHSRSSVGVHKRSEDGGLSYRTVGNVAGGQQKGWGISVRAEGDVGEWLRPDKMEPYLTIQGRYRRQDSGFSSSHNALQRGTEHGGGEVQWHLNRNQRLTVRHDTVHSDRVDSVQGQPTGRFSRMLSSAQYRHRFGRFHVIGELLHSFDDDSSENGHTGHRGSVSSLLQYRVNPRLSLFVEQQGHLGGDKRIFRSGMDRLVTAFGADVSVADDLWLTIGERVRWSGEDTALVGVRTRLSDQSEMYIEHRLHSSRDSDRRVPELVVGSEERWGADQSGRSYAEYQTGQANSGLYSRAVVGIGRSYRITKGLTADVAYERSHQSRVDGLGMDGESNTLSLGVAYLGNRNLSLTSRFETRFESTGSDRLQLVSLNRLRARLTPSLDFIVRANTGITQNLDQSQREAETMELNIGLAYRPLSDDFSLLLKAARIVDMRPVSLDADSGTNRTTSDVVSVEPIVSLPWGFQFAPKVAYRHGFEEAEGMKAVHSHTILAAFRLALSLWNVVDLAGEYRWMYVNLAKQMEHGALAELSAHITRYARIGVGYNFSYFDDDLFDVVGGNTHGFFVRLTGIY